MTDVTTSDIKKVSENCRKKNLPPIRGWCSTGCTVLDLAITDDLPGGIPIGRIIQCYGGESTCKSVLATTILGYAQRNDMLAYYDDVEQTLDPKFAELYGLDCSDEKTFTLLHSTTIEEMFDENVKTVLFDKKLKKTHKVYAIDSLTALPTEVELKADLKKGSFGMSRAKQISIALRKYNDPLANNNMTLFCIDQTRDNISGYGDREIPPGGKSLKFYASVRIYLKTDTKIVNKHDKIIGMWVKFVIKKNKVGIPFREGRFKIVFSYGLDDIATSLYFLSEVQNGIDNARKKLTMISFMNEEKKLATWVNHIERDNLEDKLVEEVHRVWKQLYKAEDRKPRCW